MDLKKSLEFGGFKKNLQLQFFKKIEKLYFEQCTE
jgi:hypothetical protein